MSEFEDLVSRQKSRRLWVLLYAHLGVLLLFLHIVASFLVLLNLNDLDRPDDHPLISLIKAAGKNMDLVEGFSLFARYASFFCLLMVSVTAFRLGRATVSKTGRSLVRTSVIVALVTLIAFFVTNASYEFGVGLMSSPIAEITDTGDITENVTQLSNDRDSLLTASIAIGVLVVTQIAVATWVYLMKFGDGDKPDSVA